MNDDSWALETFSGTARLFPLPNLVMFPHVVQPLHIFEPRYRQMTEDALAGDRLIAPILLHENWEKVTEGLPPVHGVGCLGRIVADKQLDDGRYLLLLRGLSRVSVRRELDSGRMYRSAEVELLDDGPPLPVTESQLLRGELAALILPRFAGAEQSKEQLQALFEGEMPLAALCDCLAYQLPLGLPVKQRLLEQTDIGLRARSLVETLRIMLPPTHGQAGEPRKFPPDFSLN